jgi:hypothetical protein
MFQQWMRQRLGLGANPDQPVMTQPIQNQLGHVAPLNQQPGGFGQVIGGSVQQPGGFMPPQFPFHPQQMGSMSVPQNSGVVPPHMQFPQTGNENPNQHLPMGLEHHVGQQPGGFVPQEPKQPYGGPRNPQGYNPYMW